MNFLRVFSYVHRPLSMSYQRSFSSYVLAPTQSSLAALAAIPAAPADKILGLTVAFNRDRCKQKINLGVGAYRTAAGKPHVLPSVRQAEESVILQRLDKEYAPINGIPEFIRGGLAFAYGSDSPVISRIAAAQTISGTGGLRVMGELLSHFLPNAGPLHIPDPTWGNHNAIFKKAGMEVSSYRYYSNKNKKLDFEGLMSDVESAADGSIFLLHACAHNPTGCDPSHEQWNALSALMKRKQHVPFFDSAYQGFASGDAEKDAYSIRRFVSDGHNVMLVQSFAKNFGLYGERVGLLSIVTDNAEQAERVTSQLKLIIRGMYSSPPLHGARIAAEILNNPALKLQWASECKEMADRIMRMRALLRMKLEAGDSSEVPDKWKHITEQIGMFCYTGLSVAQVHRLKSEFSIYSTDDGRFSMAGINEANVDYLASSVLNVL